MSVPLSSLRSHFFKHLACYSSTASFFSFHRRKSRFSYTNGFSFFSSVNGKQQMQLQNKKISAVSCSSSSHPLNNNTVNIDHSFTSPYLSVRICCSRDVADVLSECLMCFGASSTTISELEVCENDDEIWIGSIFNIDQDVKDCISQAADSVGLKEIPCYEVEMHDHTDWITKTQDSFHPLQIIDGLWIIPEWRKPPDLEAINVILNPGLAFGTGEHPTTKLCLLQLHRLIEGGEYFLDYGTGSGVLAIAALKLGAALSVGFDIESQAIASVRYNAALNSIAPDKLLVSLVPSTDSPQFDSQVPLNNIDANDLYIPELVAEKGKYDIVIANILFHPLLDLASRIVSYAKPGATICISGIISEQVPSVMQHYSQFMDEIGVSIMNDWACISGLKKQI